MMKKFSKIAVYVLLLLMMVGGVAVIMHKPCWTMDDDTIIQCNIGMGKLMKVNEPPVFVPEQGRFFPLGYQHNNLVLLFDHRDQVPASSVYALNAIVWCVFVALLYWLCVVSMRGRVRSGLARWLALLVVIILAQRTFQMFTILWTISYWAYFLVVLSSVVLYYYFQNKSIESWISLIFLSTYLTFVCETFLIIPFILGFISFLSIGNSPKDTRLGWSMVGIVLLFAVMYLCLIFPHITAAYDGAHGVDVSRMQNMINILLGQKLLLLVFATFVWRLYCVFIKKEIFDRFSDTLLCVAIGLIAANFVMCLNFYIYYLLPILFATPSMLSLISFDTRTKTIWSIVGLLLVAIYFIPKYPHLIKEDILQFRDKNFDDFSQFDSYCKSASHIVWYQADNSENSYDDKNAHSHLCMHLSQALQQPNFHLQSLDNSSEFDSYVLIVPSKTKMDDVMLYYGIADNVVWTDTVMSLKVYNIKK